MSSLLTPILIYHDVYKTSVEESGFQKSSAHQYKVSSKEFEKQIKLIDNWIENQNIKREEFFLTFDDGGVSFYTIIAPILEKNNLKGCFFITTSLIGTQGFLDKEQILELHKRGHFIGAHSHTHPAGMSRIDQKLLEEEWYLSSSILSDIIGEKIKIASIPGGSSSNHVYATMIKYGIESIYTSLPGTNIKEYNDASIYPRYGVKAQMSNQYVLSILTNKVTRFRIKIRKSFLSFIKSIMGTFYFIIRTKIYQLRSK